MSDLNFAPGKSVPRSSDVEPWIVVIADDEGDVHLITRMVLKNFVFEDRPLELISTYSGEETVQLLEKYPNTAILLLDVVMESYTAGLDAVDAIREKNGNREVRILLRSGQAGYANVSEVIQQYDVNAFIRKEHITNQNLKDAVLVALRSYRDIQTAKNRGA